MLKENESTKYKTSAWVVEYKDGFNVYFFSDNIRGIPPAFSGCGILGVFDAHHTVTKTTPYLSVNDSGGWVLLDPGGAMLCAAGKCYEFSKAQISRSLIALRAYLPIYPKVPALSLALFKNDSIETWGYYEQEGAAKRLERAVISLNEGQKVILDAILNETAIKGLTGSYRLSNVPALYLIYGPAGTGKTRLLNTILDRLQEAGINVIVVAPTKMAASNYPGGRTVHSVFGVPWTSNATTTCKTANKTAATIANLRVLIWDEIGSSSKFLVNAVSEEFKKYHNKDIPFGGVMVIFGGDFYQLRPIPEKGQKEAEISVVFLPFWKGVKKFELTQNMRAREDPKYTDFVEKMKIATKITIPSELRVGSTVQLAEFVYPGVGGKLPENYFSSRAILCARKCGVYRYNKSLLNVLAGEPAFIAYRAGGKARKLTLKVGCPLICTRNIGELVNGTRLVCVSVKDGVVSAKAISGPHNGEIFEMRENHGHLPFALGFAQTIYKAQGQTLARIGIAPGDGFFTHGQAYVAFSRTTGGNNVRVFCNKETLETCNDLIYIKTAHNSSRY